mmetsp:Transcript_20457/g.43043  ORF Transcript_20457/g.43043 Transcript_20457/m.43043 type:complete len:885 (-) Transcript_20457:72-2726(-)
MSRESSIPMRRTDDNATNHTITDAASIDGAKNSSSSSNMKRANIIEEALTTPSSLVAGNSRMFGSIQTRGVKSHGQGGASSTASNAQMTSQQSVHKDSTVKVDPTVVATPTQSEAELGSLSINEIANSENFNDSLNVNVGGNRIASDDAQLDLINNAHENIKSTGLDLKLDHSRSSVAKSPFIPTSGADAENNSDDSTNNGVDLNNDPRKVTGKDVLEAIKMKLENEVKNQRNFLDNSDRIYVNSKGSLLDHIRGPKSEMRDSGAGSNVVSRGVSHPCVDEEDAASRSTTPETVGSFRSSHSYNKSTGVILKDTTDFTSNLTTSTLTPCRDFNGNNHVSGTDYERIDDNIKDTKSTSSTTSSGYDKNRLTERMRQRFTKRSQMRATGDFDTSSSAMSSLAISRETNPINEEETLSDFGTDKSASTVETRLTRASRRRLLQRAQSYASNSSKETHQSQIQNLSAENIDILSKYGLSPKGTIGKSNLFPDTVTFSDGEEETNVVAKPRRAYRKTSSEVGTSSMPSRDNRSKFTRHSHPHHDGIGILQADGIVFDNSLLQRLARQVRYGKMRKDFSTGTDGEGTTYERRYNDVKIHVYDLLARDALVEMPYFNCNFPIGQCFNVMNNGLHCLGTGAYHVGVEVNGVEYAFGANNIIGMSGIFTCTPKESPGYEFRETLDFGKVHTTKKTWIRIPKEKMFDRTVSSVLGESQDGDDKEDMNRRYNRSASTLEADNHSYYFREIETFTDGHAIIHSMAREYLGTDYDFLRKNCCTFALDVCLRIGVEEEDIPSWFHNAAKAGANAEDVITNVEKSVKNMFDLNDDCDDKLELEGSYHGFEVIVCKAGTSFNVVEATLVEDNFSASQRQPLLEDNDRNEEQLRGTVSWTY